MAYGGRPAVITRTRPSDSSQITTTPSRTSYSPPPYSCTRFRTYAGAGVTSDASPPATGHRHRLVRPVWSAYVSSQ